MTALRRGHEVLSFLPINPVVLLPQTLSSLSSGVLPCSAWRPLSHFSFIGSFLSSLRSSSSFSSPPCPIFLSDPSSTLDLFFSRLPLHPLFFSARHLNSQLSTRLPVSHQQLCPTTSTVSHQLAVHNEVARNRFDWSLCSFCPSLSVAGQVLTPALLAPYI